jgi:hypothetical protein
MWPSEEWASRLFNWANMGLISSLIVGVVSTALLVWMGNVKEAYGKITQHNFELELSKQQERTAKAERELLEERQHAANRDISPEDQNAISENLKAFAGQHGSIEIFPVTFESRFLAAQVEGILINAKWSMPPSPKLLTAPPITTVQGVGIFSTPDEQSKAAAKELFRLLAATAAGGVLIQPGSPETSRTELPNPENPRVVVLVGDKPTPLRSWAK